MSITFCPIRNPATYVNLANDNAYRLMAVAGLPQEPYGECPTGDLHAVAHRLLRALNGRTVYSAPTEVSPEGTRCRVVYGGTTEERERQRLHDLLQVVVACIKTDTALTWS